METRQLQTESYLFSGPDGQFRALPFYELSIDEWVVFENGHPKYLIDFNRRKMPLIIDLNNKLKSGEPFEETVQKIGRFIGREWTIKHNIQGDEVPGSHLDETITLLLLDSLGDLFMDVVFIATDNVNLEILLDEDRFTKKFLTDMDEAGIENAYAENQEDLIMMLSFVFGQSVELIVVAERGDKNVFDLTGYKEDCITIAHLDNNYENWLRTSKRETSMTQYGILLNAVAYIRNNIDKKNLLTIVEKRIHWQ